MTDTTTTEQEYHNWLLSKNYSRNHADSCALAARRVLEFTAIHSMRTPEDFNALLTFMQQERAYSPRSLAPFKNRAAAFLRWLCDEKGCQISMPEQALPHADPCAAYPEEYRRIYAEYIREKEFARTPANSMKKISTALRRWFDHLQSRGVDSLNAVRKEDAREFGHYLSGLSGRNGLTAYRPESVNRVMADVKTFLLWLSRKGLCVGQAARLTSMKVEQKVSRNIFTRKELARFWAVKTQTPFEFMLKTLMIFLYSTGVRVGEALGLELRHLEPQSRRAVIFEPKTGKERAVLFGDIARQYLELYLKHVRPLVLKNTHDAPLVFVSPRLGKNLSPEVINSYIATFCARAEIKKHLTCHCFRHSYGTHLLENGAGIRQVSELLGHEKLSTTEGYTRLTPERLRETLRKHHPLEGAKP